MGYDSAAMSSSAGPVAGQRHILSIAATILASGLGAGYSPIAPGTAGSAVGLLLLWPQAGLSPLVRLLLIVALVIVGIPAAGLVARRLGQKDPGLVVIDEVAGMWLTVAWLPWTPLTLSLGFFLFRALDVLKPYPARELEAVPGGYGIMFDDLAAGLIANLLLRVVLLVLPAA
jgi:phosphatidylglycerophosphatase A